MTVPSIKATLFQTNADELGSLIASGRISNAQIAQRLDSEDLKYFGKQLAASSWVPISTSTKILELLFELSGEADVCEFMRGRGRRGAERLRRTGIYSQLRDQPANEVAKHGARIAVSISSLMLNFTRWTPEEGEDVLLRIVVDDAAHFPDLNRFAAEGFIEHVVEGSPGNPKVAVSSKRVAPDRIVFVVEPA